MIQEQALKLTWKLATNVLAFRDITFTYFAVEIEPCLMRLINWQTLHRAFLILSKCKIHYKVYSEMCSPLTFV